MVFKRPGNRRDDRSARSPKGDFKGDDKGGRPAGSRNTRSSFSGDKQQGDKPYRSLSETGGDKKPFGGKRKPYSGRPESDDRPKRNFDRESTGEKRSYGPRKSAPYGTRSASDDRPKKSFNKESSGGKKGYGSGKSAPYGSRSGGDDRPKRTYDRESSGEKPSYGPRKSAPYGTRSDGDDRPRRNDDRDSSGEKRSYASRKSAPYGSRPEGDDRPKRSSNREQSGEKRSYGSGKSAPYGTRSESGDRPKRNPDSYRGGSREGERGGFKKRGDDSGSTPFRKSENSSYNKPKPERSPEERVMRSRRKPESDDSGLIRLNRYISNAGICSRRKADELIAAGVISVNGEVISELGHKVDPAKDMIRYNGETLKREKNVYVLLNKPKDYITTTDDPQERRTVMHLVEKASRERIYPVGRLDRNTTGLLLLTNDGDLADKLSHPKNNITKIYQAELDKSLTQGDLNKIAFGLELEDGPVKPDMISYVSGGTKRDIGIQIHSGKNRIVRRIFEHLGYDVVKLDRSVYANLTKKDLPRGRWRYLDEKEVIQLKHLI
ncbi:MAG TPA: pseudouridine synthase [Mucilaginibacter sp.]|jgi:23S rRNA pseudouridine2605 synthase|nr:pseudouridine synthase [Mucilaginibacter sp.]